MINFPPQNQRDLRAYDKSVLVTRVCLGLPTKNLDRVPEIRPLDPEVFWGSGRVRHGHLKSSPPLTMVSCVTYFTADFSTMSWPGRFFPCPCGQVLWRLPKIRNRERYLEDWADTQALAFQLLPGVKSWR